MAAVRSADLIEKMSSADKDFRFMAINDIMEHLKNKAITLDDTTENQLVQNLLKMLSDSNAEVQNLDVKCIALVVNYLGQQRLFTTLDSICTKILDGEEESLRDISAIALRLSIIEFDSLKSVSFNAVVDRLLPQLVKILGTSQDHSVNEQILDIISHMFRRTGNKLDFNYDGLNGVLFNHAESERYGVRRRAQQALSLYADVVDNNKFKAIVKQVYECCQKYTSKTALLKTYISTTTAICKNSGHRFQESLPSFVELFLQICNRSQEDELREVTLNAFETFFYRCPDAINPYIKQISDIVIALLSHDPNYSYDDDNENAMDIDERGSDNEEGDAEGDDEDDSDYSDDEDVSWKVRRASAKCIEAIITHRHDYLYQNYQTFGKLLIKRMKEREDNVKQDIMNAYMGLIRETRLLVPDTIVPLTLRTDGSCLYERIDMNAFERYINEDGNRKKIFEILHEQLPLLLRQISAAQKTKNIKVLEQTFILLTSLITAYPECIGSSLPQLSRGIKHSLNDRDGNMKHQTLRFLSSFFATHNYSEYENGIESIIYDVFKLAGDTFSKVSSESIEVINSLICSMASSASSIKMNQKLLEEIYKLLITKFQVTDMDQEVKDKTTYGLGFFISSFGDSLDSTLLNQCLQLLVDRLSNEISRQSSLKALTLIAKSEKNYSISAIIQTITPFFGEFFRKNNRSLRLFTLSLAISIAERPKNGNFYGINLESTVIELPQLLVESDLQIAQLALHFMGIIISKYPSQIGNGNNGNILVDGAIKFTRSALVQGKTQKSLLEFFDAYSASNIQNKLEFRDIVGQFMEYVNTWKAYIRPSYFTVSKCIAHLARGTNNILSVLPLTKELEKFVFKGQSIEIKILSILIIGELGRIFPDVYNEKNSIKPEEITLNCFKPTCEEDLKMSASQALGSLAVGNIKRFLPFILTQIKEQPTRQYLLVYALRELITSDSVDSAGQELFSSNIDTIWQGIITQANSTESTRVVVAECLGKISLMNPSKYLPELVKCFKSSDSLIRSTAVIAIRYMISDQPCEADNILIKILPTFYQGVKDENIDTRRLSIVLASTVANHKPFLIRESLDEILPYVYLETTPRKELQREVEMGPFKNLVDDGIELRRSAFECLYNLVEHCLDRVSFYEFAENVEKGLNDAHDIKQLTYLTLIRLTETCPHQIAQRSDSIADIMKAHLSSKPKQNAVKIDTDKEIEMKRMVIRTLVSMKKMSTHERLPKVNELYEYVTKEFSTLLSEVKNDGASSLSSSTA
jgi:hypothetical protein